MSWQMLLLLVCAFLDEALSDYLLRTLDGTVGGGNYTYYKLTQDGDIRLEMISTEGDADIYVAYSTLSPEYDNYEMKSVTCGVDEVEIESTMKRPIGIGIFGYPQYDKSHFTLKVYLANNKHTVSYKELAAAHAYSNTPTETFLPNKMGPGENDESLVWDIFITILKIIFDILT